MAAEAQHEAGGADPVPAPPRITEIVMVSWTVAGGIFWGGIAFLFAGLFDPVIGASGPATAFAFGAAAGFVHGLVLSRVGRPLHVTPVVWGQRARLGVLWSVLASLPALAVALWIALGPGALRSGQILMLGLSVIATGVGLLVCVWAAYLGVQAVRNLGARWPEWRRGVTAGVLSYALLAAVLALVQPRIWWTDVRVTFMGAAWLALGLTLWIALPLAALAFRTRRR